MRRKRKTGAEEAIRDEAAAPEGSGEHPVPPIEGVPVLIPRVDSDGISRLELDETTVTVAPWELDSNPPPMPTDRDKRSAAGEVPKRKGPAGVVAAAAAAMETSGVHKASAPTPAASMTLITQRDRPAWFLPLALVAVAAMAIAMYVFVLRDPARPEGGGAVAESKDGGVVVPPPVGPSTLIVETVPPGAVGTAGDIRIGPTPATLEVPAGKAPLRLELTGYEPYVDDSVRVEAGQTLRLHLTLTPARARLAVETEPLDVDVELDGELLGKTPLARKDLPPRKNARLRLSKTGFLPQTVTVELIGGDEARVFRALKAAPTPTGTITITVEDEGGATWGEVFLAGKKLGTVGAGTASAITLPAGRHKLTVKNPATGKSATIDVDVRADQTRTIGVTIK
jgi:hypothetical protein